MNVTTHASWMREPTATEEGVLGIRIMSDSPVARAIHIGLVLDTSGSMEGERIAAVKRTLTVMIQRLQDGDKISVVGFSDVATRLFMSHTLDATNRADSIKTVERLDADGGTNMEAGIVALGEMFQGDDVKPNALVLLTDGQVNQGIVTTAGLASILRSYLPNVPVYTLGYGSDHNADLLRALSARTQATYTYIDNEIALPASIGDLLGGLQNEVASTSAVTFPVTGWKCLELNPAEAGRYEAGSLIADKPSWVMFSVAFGSEARLSLHYTNSTTRTSARIPIVIGTELAACDITDQYLRCKTARVLSDVTDLLKQDRLREAKVLLTVCRDLLTNAVQTTLVIRMKAQVDELYEEVVQSENESPQRRRGVRSNIDAIAMRTSSTAQNYSAQRGVTGGGLHVDTIFSSPAMIRHRTRMVEQYTQRAEDPDVVNSLRTIT